MSSSVTVLSFKVCEFKPVKKYSVFKICDLRLNHMHLELRKNNLVPVTD
jgi:hypothetical protein